MERGKRIDALRNNFVTISHEIFKRPSNYSASPWQGGQARFAGRLRAAGRSWILCDWVSDLSGGLGREYCVGCEWEGKNGEPLRLAV